MVRFILVAVLATVGCGSDDPVAAPAIYPLDYETTYQEVRNCRNSLEHNGVRMRVLASPEAIAPYTGRALPFPAGSIVLKVQYDGGDTSCEDEVIGATVMRKLAPGSSPDTLDWEWQETDETHREIEFEVRRCTMCHKQCDPQYDATCTDP